MLVNRLSKENPLLFDLLSRMHIYSVKTVKSQSGQICLSTISIRTPIPDVRPTPNDLITWLNPCMMQTFNRALNAAGREARVAHVPARLRCQRKRSQCADGPRHLYDAPKTPQLAGNRELDCERVHSRPEREAAEEHGDDQARGPPRYERRAGESPPGSSRRCWSFWVSNDSCSNILRNRF